MCYHQLKLQLSNFGEEEREGNSMLQVPYPVETPSIPGQYNRGPYFAWSDNVGVFRAIIRFEKATNVALTASHDYEKPTLTR